MYKEHPAFSPPHDDVVLWRYMNFIKFTSLLVRSELFFARADKLGDSFEGTIPKMNRLQRSIWYPEASSESLQGRANFERDLPRFTLINCWHESTEESTAMWGLYTNEIDGIAIKTDFASLKESLTCEQDIYVGSVSYIDYEVDTIFDQNAYVPYLHKRSNFAHEKEVRAIVPIIPVNDGRLDTSQDICDVGIHYKVDLSRLIKEIIVAPKAENWHLEVIKSVAAQYNLEAPIIKSRLADFPTWG